ncbi:MAG: ABC transporter ATP-binding protein [Flavobacteriales bacterium]|nr:ABC transporter ATP-binding protein [Flavobacteriales bacterium]
MKTDLEIANLSIGYPNKTIASSINISTNSGQLIALIGRNGDGKSTLLKTLAGVHPPLSGDFRFRGQPVLTISSSERAKLLSIVTTYKMMLEHVCVRDFIAFGRYPYTNWLGVTSEQDDSLVEQAIELCGIASFSDRHYEELSDGEKQRVHIARAIAQQGELILLDEPTTHLDLINKIELLKLLKSLVQDHGKTVIFSTHMVEHALRIADEVWMIREGVVHHASPSELVKDELFRETFSSNAVQFDPASGSFRMI